MDNKDIAINKQSIVLKDVIGILQDKAKEHSHHTQENFNEFLIANRVSIVENITKNLTHQELIDICFKRVIINEDIRKSNEHNKQVCKHYYNTVANKTRSKSTRKAVINRILSKTLLKDQLEAIA